MFQKSRRNALCDCGSGKKYKNCCINKKERHEAIQFKIDQPISRIRIGPNQQVTLLNNNQEVIPIHSSFVKSYERNTKGEKVILDIPTNTPALIYDEVHFLKSFDLLFGLDTNTVEYFATKISAATFVQCKFLMQDIVQMTIVDQPYAYDIPDNPEKSALLKLLSGIKYKSGQRIGIVTDCDYGNIPSINKREVPILNDTYLPTGCTLIYASSDSGKENLVNQIISFCDKESTKLLQEIKKSPDCFPAPI